MEQFMAWRHGRGGGRGGPFGFGGPGGPWGRGGRGRRARRGDVRLAVLRLLAEEPRNGYQLMQTIEERSGDLWRPSPGSMYPTLAQLEDEGLIRSTDSGAGRVFEITDTGREHLETRRGEPDPWEVEHGDQPISEIRPLIGQVAAAAMQVASVAEETQRARAVEVLRETRRALYRILAEEPDGEDDHDAGPAGPAGPGDPGI
jgi:DNA-binding PadR family transcriptional regulator